MLKNHPFAVEAFFERSVVLTFAVPKEEVASLIPPCLTLDTYQEKYAFVAAAVVQTRGLRPKGFPRILGRDFILTGYRIFVRYTTSSGKRLRGLYILGSVTNSPGMAFWGNVFTHYNYQTTPIHVEASHDRISFRSPKSGFHLSFLSTNDVPRLPEGSPFQDWRDARKFSGPLPFTFTFEASKNQVLLIEGVRRVWKPEPVQVEDFAFPFIDNLNLPNLQLANAFEIQNVPYYWKKGKLDQWTPAENLSKG